MRAVAFSKAKIESEISSRFGDAFKLRQKTAAQVISTGIPELDCLTGGLPRGAITEIFGPTSSGRTSLMLAALTQATGQQEICGVIDANDSLAPASAATAGVLLDRLLWIRCSAKLENAFKATDLVLQGGGFGLVFLDLGDVPTKDTKRIISSWWYRFRRVVENTPTVFVVIGQESCVRSCASLTLQLKRETDTWLSRKTPLSSNLASPFGKLTDKLPLVDPLKSPHPTHANLLLDMGVRVERQKPVTSGTREIQFTAGVSP